MNEPLKSSDTADKGSFYFFIRDNQEIFIQILAVSLLLLLLVPFYKTFVISVIFYAGLRETRRMVQKLPRPKKWLFRTIFYCVATGFIFLFYWVIDKASESSILFSKTGARKTLIDRFKEVYNSNIEIIEKRVVSIFPSVNRTDVHDQFIQGLQSFLESSFNWLIDFFSDLPMLVLQIGFFVTVIIWFAHSKGKSFDFFTKSIGRYISRDRRRRIWAMVEDCSYQTLICTFLVSLVQAGILGVAALVLDLPGWPFIFLIAFIFSFFPVVGTLPAAAIGLFLAYNNGGTSTAGLFLIAALITSVADNFLRTWLISAQESVTPGSFNFFAIIGGIALFGFPGVLIGPFVLAYATALLKKSSE